MWKATRILPVILTAVVGLVSTCDDNPLTPRVVDFEVHEWGVMVGCAADSSYFLTSRPEIVAYVDIPVIYVHSKDKTPFTAQVTFNSGRPTDTYPEAEVDSTTVVWENVNFPADLDTAGTKVAGDHIPLEYIIHTLNNVDADRLEYDSQITRFLFYEGQASFRNVVEATYDYDTEQATFKNNGAYQVFNLMLAATRSDDSLFGPDVYVAEIERLMPGKQVTVDFSQQVSIDLAADLVGQGFTQKEAEAFARLWREPFLYPTLTIGIGARANLIYRLPQYEYDKLITLDIDPQPDRTIRSLYMLVHLDPSSNLADFEVHEWGVMVGCASDTSYFLTSRPELTGLVREPVIYVHSRNKTPFTAEVRFHKGEPTDTYPVAQKAGKIVRWRDVGFCDEAGPRSLGPPGGFVPLDSIKDILNDVDANCLDYNGQTARFLFYEGEMSFVNNIDVTFDFDNRQVTFENRGSYPVYNSIAVVGSYVGDTDQLHPGTSITVPLSLQTEVDLTTDLVSEGFTIKEARAFATLWQPPFMLGNSPVPVHNLMYRIPQDEYEKLISLSINPEPDKTIRSLYILVHLNR